MTQPTDRPGINQLRNLADRAERGPLTADEAARLRAGIAKLDTRINGYRDSRKRWMDSAFADRRASNELASRLAEAEQRAELAEAALAEEKADNDALRKILLRGGYKPLLDQAEATLTAVRELATWIRRNYPGLDHGRRLLGLLDQHGQTTA